MQEKYESSNSQAKVGKPRLDPIERQLHRFYEPLVLLAILDPTRGGYERQVAPDPLSEQYKFPWQKVLDGLSQLCDYEKGGETVPAIGAESTPPGPKFWIAANKRRSFTHLQWVLERLKSLYRVSPPTATNVQKTIAAKSIDLSKKKVDTYFNSFCKSVEEARKTLRGPVDRMTIRVLEELYSMKDVQDSHYKLCFRAYTFKHFFHLKHLKQQEGIRNQPSPWSEVYHFVGRLGSWFRISELLVCFVQKYPLSIEGSTAAHLEIPIADRIPEADSKTNIESALKRMLPAREQARVSELYESLRNMRDFDIDESFKSRYSSSNFQPRVHAEMVVLEHFHQNKLEFVSDERYIGCSKPSCYCCGLYMRMHPGNFVLRPCHGNLWACWAPPLPLNTYNQDLREHTRNILNDMSKHVRRDVLQLIESKAPRKKRVLDSTTGTLEDVFAQLNV